MEDETRMLSTIQVMAESEEEVTANRADLFVTVQGSSFVTGSMALKKAREVNLLVTELTSFGLTEQEIKLESVSAEASSGVFGKSSSAHYSLRIHCNNLDRLADIIGIITGQKNSRLDSVDWLYPEVETYEDRLLTLCIRRANQKATLIARELGVRLLGIHSFLTVGSYPGEYLSGGISAIRSRQERVTAQELGLEVSHTKTVSMNVQVTYRVSDFPAREETGS